MYRLVWPALRGRRARRWFPALRGRRAALVSLAANGASVAAGFALARFLR